MQVKAKEVSNTRVATNLQMRKETLKDMAKPILTEDQQEFRRQEVRGSTSETIRMLFENIGSHFTPYSLQK